MNTEQADRLIRAVENAGPNYEIWFLIAMIFIASYLGWIALRLKEINKTLKSVKGRDFDL